MGEPRTSLILEEVLRTGNASVEELAGAMAVSPATIRRDLALLEQQGLLRRVRGGAVPIEPMRSELFLQDSAFQEAMSRHQAEKRRIGLAAAELVQDGDTIMLAAGTTVALLARSLRHRKGISVVTNNMNVALELSQREGISVLVTGGYLLGDWFSIVGHSTLDLIRSMKVDKAFFGMSGIDPVRGFTGKNEDEAVVNRAMIRQAEMVVAVGDHSKLGTVAGITVCSPDQVDLLITDTGADETAVAALQETGTRVWKV